MFRSNLTLHTALMAIVCLLFSASLSLAQSCVYENLTQEFSYGDTLNSSGAPLSSAHLVFQQDRFYVNQKNRLDPNDLPDAITDSKQARATYGRAVKSYLNANSMQNISVQSLVGSNYVVVVEACGSKSDPTIRVVDMRMENNLEDERQLRELETHKAELAELEQRLQERKVRLDQWEQQLRDWERRLADMSDTPKVPEPVVSMSEQEVLKTDFLSQYTGQDLTFIFQSERLDLVSVLGSKLYCDMAVPAWQNKKSSSDLNARLMNNMYLSTKFGSANAVFATRHRIDCVAGFPSDFDRNQAVSLCQAHNKDQNRRIEFDNLGLPISFMTDGGKWLLDWSDFKLKNEVVTATTFNGIKTELFVCVDK